MIINFYCWSCTYSFCTGSYNLAIVWTNEHLSPCYHHLRGVYFICPFCTLTISTRRKYFRRCLSDKVSSERKKESCKIELGKKERKSILKIWANLNQTETEEKHILSSWRSQKSWWKYKHRTKKRLKYKVWICGTNLNKSERF